tara:strand:- start:323 stop:619 length:297 start_codon:yes stop_codon:yes gene_type:complete
MSVKMKFEIEVDVSRWAVFASIKDMFCSRHTHDMPEWGNLTEYTREAVTKRMAFRLRIGGDDFISSDSYNEAVTKSEEDYMWVLVDDLFPELKETKNV